MAHLTQKRSAGQAETFSSALPWIFSGASKGRRRDPPNILMTTPEQLALLASADALLMFDSTRLPSKKCLAD